MRVLETYNPIVLFIYFIAAAGISMFCMHPVILAVSLAGAALFCFLLTGRGTLRSHLCLLGLFLFMAMLNPLFYHNGVTVLFMLNHNPVTLEALLYGISASTMVLAVIYWSRSFTYMMTEDKLLYLFGTVSPKLALILSMALRYMPLFGSQAKKVNQAQRALGLYREDNFMDTLRGGIRIFSIMTTWALETGIVTADSMTARGYGTGRRSSFLLYRFRVRDVVMLCVIAVLTALTLVGMGNGALRITFYPAIDMPEKSPLMILACLAYGLLVFLPSLLTIGGELTWKYWQSKT